MTLKPEKINQKLGTPGWLELYDLSLHGDMEAQTPKGAYIRGMIGTKKEFAPTSEILGKAIPKPEEISSSPGWVELETLQFHRDIEAVAPIPPYVHGEMDEDNHFYPDEPYEIMTT